MIDVDVLAIDSAELEALPPDERDRVRMVAFEFVREVGFERMRDELFER